MISRQSTLRSRRGRGTSFASTAAFQRLRIGRKDYRSARRCHTPDMLSYTGHTATRDRARPRCPCELQLLRLVPLDHPLPLGSQDVLELAISLWWRPSRHDDLSLPVQPRTTPASFGSKPRLAVEASSCRVSPISGSFDRFVGQRLIDANPEVSARVGSGRFPCSPLRGGDVRCLADSAAVPPHRPRLSATTSSRSTSTGWRGSVVTEPTRPHGSGSSISFPPLRAVGSGRYDSPTGDGRRRQPDPSSHSASLPTPVAGRAPEQRLWTRGLLEACRRWSVRREAVSSISAHRSSIGSMPRSW